jgi:hypothetical protein
MGAFTGSLSAAVDEKFEATVVKGEILDLACYADHGAAGEKHMKCAGKCISSGLPVGIKGEDGKVYIVIGDHKPMNSELAEYAGKVVTLKGKSVSKDGVNLLANAELVK